MHLSKGLGIFVLSGASWKVLFFLPEALIFVIKWEK